MSDCLIPLPSTGKGHRGLRFHVSFTCGHRPRLLYWRVIQCRVARLAPKRMRLDIAAFGARERLFDRKPAGLRAGKRLVQAASTLADGTRLKPGARTGALDNNKSPLNSDSSVMN